MSAITEARDTGAALRQERPPDWMRDWRPEDGRGSLRRRAPLLPLLALAARRGGARCRRRKARRLVETRSAP